MALFFRIFYKYLSNIIIVNYFGHSSCCENLYCDSPNSNKHFTVFNVDVKQILRVFL